MTKSDADMRQTGVRWRGASSKRQRDLAARGYEAGEPQTEKAEGCPPTAPDCEHGHWPPSPFCRRAISQNAGHDSLQSSRILSDSIYQ